jgi:hypothetical protein
MTSSRAWAKARWCGTPCVTPALTWMADSGVSLVNAVAAEIMRLLASAVTAYNQHKARRL